MDFSFSEEQEAVRDLARQIFEGRSTAERVREVESGTERFDRELWTELAKANLLGLSLPEEDGGSGLGLIESLLVLQEAGRQVAPIPLWPTLFLGALPVAAFGTDDQRSEWLPGVVAGDVVLTGAFEEPGEVTVADGQLTGSRPAVPVAHVAQRVLVPAEGAVYLVDPQGDGVSLALDEATNRQIHAELTLDGAPGDWLGGGEVVPWTIERALLGLCALQVGVCEGALAATAEYTSQRNQFGRPLSTNQGVALRAADAYIDIEAMRATLWAAAWRLSEGLDATQEILAAKWWASEGGHRVVHSTQHLHGGMGADIDYPLHRTFLWAKQIAHTLGGPSPQLVRLGSLIREEAMA